MKRLIVLRHAKSSWKDSSLDDHERPLKKRGIRDAPLVARALRERDWIPDKVLSSSAVRTCQTWDFMKEEFSDSEIPVEYLECFYHANPEEVVSEVLALDDELSTVMLLGHNPSWESLVTELSSKYIKLTTCNAVLLQSASSTWKVSGYWVVDVIRPKALK